MTVSSDTELLVFQLSWRRGDEGEEAEGGDREKGKRKAKSQEDSGREGKVSVSLSL